VDRAAAAALDEEDEEEEATEGSQESLKESPPGMDTLCVLPLLLLKSSSLAS
jgi:hypothetical protein